MKTFFIECIRSDKPEHKVAGVDCDDYRLGCTYKCRSLDLAFLMGQQWCLIPGTYTIRITDSKGSVWEREHRVEA